MSIKDPVASRDERRDLSKPRIVRFQCIVKVSADNLAEDRQDKPKINCFLFGGIVIEERDIRGKFEPE